VLVLQSEALFADPANVLRTVFRFLGLDDAADLGPLRVHKAGRDQTMPAAVRRRLEAYYAEPNRHLAQLPGIDFSWEPS
jgi:hypothetical protein